MHVSNREIAERFETLADLLEIENANPFRVRAYRNAARTVRASQKSMAGLLERGEDLSKLPCIGKDLAGKIGQIVSTGRLPLLDEVASRTPEGLSDIAGIRGLGPKRVKDLHDHLGIRSIDDLRHAIADGKVRQLAGFGEKTEQLIRKQLKDLHKKQRRVRLVDAEQIAEPLVAHLKKTEGIREVVVAGSYRRRKETVGDLDILVTATRNAPVMDRFASYIDVDEVISQGKTRSMVRLRSGMSVDLRVVPQRCFGSALAYFTGSREHVVAVRSLARKKKLKINEYGVYRNSHRIAGKSEKSVYGSLGLPLIPPELRENRGELDAARKGTLPTLIQLANVRGDLHCHTRATDGHHSLEQMAEAAVRLGHEYLSINDHSQHLAVANGLDRKRLLKQIRAIDQLNEKLNGLRLLKSIELDILENGTLDMPASVLKELDFAVCAVHDKFNLSSKKQTERILRAMDNPYCNILAHPSGRLINRREPYAIDFEKILRGARDRGCYLELNASPDRLDLTDTACSLAKEVGVRISLSTDAHSTYELANLRFGIDQARRGWLEPSDVINTLPWGELRKLFRRV